MDQKNMKEIMELYTFAPEIPKGCKERAAIIMYCRGLHAEEGQNLCDIMMNTADFQKPIGKAEASKIVDQLIGLRRISDIYLQYSNFPYLKWASHLENSIFQLTK